MKYFLIIIFILKLSSSFAQQHFIETKYFECLEASFNVHDIDLKDNMIQFEEHLIKSGVLSDASGLSYRNIYKTIAETESIDFKFNYSFLGSIKYNPEGFDIDALKNGCIEHYQELKKSKKFKKAKVYRLKEAMNSLKYYGTVDVRSTTNTILTVLNSQDFEHDYYKMNTLILLSITHPNDRERLTETPKPIKWDNSEKKRNFITIYVSTDNDSVLFNGKKCSISTLDEITKVYLLSNPNDSTMPELKTIHIDSLGDCLQSKAIIIVQNENTTQYRTYLAVYNQIKKAYLLARNHKAIELFQLNINQLSEKQKQTIKKLIPQKISESAP